MKPWYEEGLRFKCTGCGECCTGSPGYVWVSPTEAEAIAKRLGIPVEEFIKKYTRRVGDRLSLTERLRNKKYDSSSSKASAARSTRIAPPSAAPTPGGRRTSKTPKAG